MKRIYDVLERFGYRLNESEMDEHPDAKLTIELDSESVLLKTFFGSQRVRDNLNPRS